MFPGSSITDNVMVVDFISMRKKLPLVQPAIMGSYSAITNGLVEIMFTRMPESCVRSQLYL